MTREERRKPDLLNASRKRRVAAGAGVEVAEINRLLKQHRQMADAFKMMSRGGGKGLMQMARMMGLGGPGGGMPPGMGGPGAMPPGLGADLEKLKALGGGKLPEGLPNLPGLGGNPNMPGLPGGFPGLPGGKPKK
jgi:signal recognition particle subunit SRP54